jgi:hypothetical protein
MICCSLGVAAVATGVLGWRRFRRFLPGTLGAQSLLAVGAAAAVVITITALSVEHFGHHAAHASGPEMASGDPLPLCSDGDRTSIASNED